MQAPFTFQAIAFKKGIIDALHTFRCEAHSEQDELGVHRCVHNDRDSVSACSELYRHHIAWVHRPFLVENADPVGSS